MNTFKPKSFHLQWHITERCNLKCKHCYFDPVYLKNELSMDKLLSFLEQYLELMKKWGLDRKKNRVSITGGEPLKRNDFFELFEMLYENREKTRYALMTNATTLEKKTVKRIAELKPENVQVSLEGIGKANDQIRGEGSFEKARAGIRLLVSEGLNVSISMTVTRANLNQIPGMLDFCKKEGIRSIGIRRLVPIGRGEKIRSLMLSPTETKRLYQYILKKQQANDNPLFRIGIGCEGGIVSQEGLFNPKTCSAGYNSITVLPNGDVFPCRRLPLKAGNILEKSLEDIYYSSNELIKLRNLNNSDPACKACPYWIECRGGAKCVSFGYFSNPFAPDPQCWRLFEKLPHSHFEPKISENQRLDEEFVEVK